MSTLLNASQKPVFFEWLYQGINFKIGLTDCEFDQYQTTLKTIEKVVWLIDGKNIEDDVNVNFYPTLDSIVEEISNGSRSFFYFHENAAIIGHYAAFYSDKSEVVVVKIQERYAGVHSIKNGLVPCVFKLIGSIEKKEEVKRKDKVGKREDGAENKSGD